MIKPISIALAASTRPVFAIFGARDNNIGSFSMQYFSPIGQNAVFIDRSEGAAVEIEASLLAGGTALR